MISRSALRLAIFTLFGTLTVLAAAAQTTTRQLHAAYIERYKEMALDEMRRTGIPASITLAQGILESDCGRSRLAKVANNHFGIKCKKDWTGRTIRHDDDAPGECFRSYRSAGESYADHSKFLCESPRYAGLFRLDPLDYRGWAHGLKQAGYATNPRYAELLIKIIEDNRLYLLDETGDLPVETSAAQGPSAEERPETPVVVETVDPDRYTVSIRTLDGRPLGETDGCIYVTARAGDTWQSLAEATGITARRLIRMNDAPPESRPTAGEPVYLVPKRRRAAEAACTVRPGESLRQIAQRHAVKLRRLERLNGIERGTEPEPGTTLKLR